ncbi:hypothetical protein [Chryseobacterium mucoviscidosis]|uniref:hypothetical protein n=1 Tax=Chryseobacterium mucoviscidosis TaxID=1945581 RepID=UPI0031D012AB
MGIKADPVFSKLITDENDIVGYLAYSLYIQEKQEFIKSKPDATQANVSVFEQSCLIEARISAYREKSDIMLSNLVGAKSEKISDEINKEHYARLQEIFNKNKQTFLSKFLEGLIISVLSAAVFLIVFFSVKYFGSDLLNWFNIPQPS